MRLETLVFGQLLFLSLGEGTVGVHHLSQALRVGEEIVDAVFVARVD